MLEYGDKIMADKGVIIAEDLLRNCQLHIPPGKRRNEQMRRSEVKKTKEIANLRIIVEQSIRRLKTFRILKFEIPNIMLDNCDDINIVCAALCYLYPPITISSYDDCTCIIPCLLIIFRCMLYI